MWLEQQFLIGMEAGKSKIKVLASLVPSEGFLADSCLLAVSSLWQGGGIGGENEPAHKLSGLSFYKVINPIWRVHIHDLI